MEKRFIVLTLKELKQRFYKYKIKENNMNKTKILTSILLGLVLTLGLVSAMTLSIDANNFSPGEEQEISVDVKNTLDEDAEDVSLSLDMGDLPFTILSYDDTKNIDSEDKESFDFAIKASNNAEAGDYSIPYTIDYSINGSAQTPKEGKIVLTIEANPELTYSVNTEKAIIGTQGKIKFTIVNKGLGDAKFVGVKIIPDGYTLLSADNDYVGTIGSDDFETISFDAIFNEKNPILNAEIEYRDFNNQKVTKSVTLPIIVYSAEEALKLGIIKQDNTSFYVIGGIIILAVWFVVRKIRKKKRQNKAQGK